MENFASIQSLIAEGEGSRLEFKLLISDPYKLATTLCAMANTRGGHILVGVMDNGEIAGIVDEMEQLSRIFEAAQLLCEPPIPIVISHYEENFLQVLSIDIVESCQKPHSAYLKNGNLGVFIRVDSRTMPASPTVIKSLQNEYPLSNTPNDVIDSQEVDSKEMELLAYLKAHSERGITLQQFMQLLNLSQRRAKRYLIRWVQEGKIRHHSQDGGEFYTLS